MPRGSLILPSGPGRQSSLLGRVLLASFASNIPPLARFPTPDWLFLLPIPQTLI